MNIFTIENNFFLDWRDGDSIVERRKKRIQKILELDKLINHSKANSEFVNISSKFFLFFHLSLFSFKNNYNAKHFCSVLNSMQKFYKAKKQLGLRKNLKNLITLTLASSSNTPSYTSVNYANLKFTKQIKQYIFNSQDDIFWKI